MNYSTNPIPATTMATIRIALVGLATFAVGRGWISQGEIEGYVAGILGIGAAVWGIWQTYHRQHKLVTAEKAMGPIDTKVMK